MSPWQNEGELEPGNPPTAFSYHACSSTVRPTSFIRYFSSGKSQILEINFDLSGPRLPRAVPTIPQYTNTDVLFCHHFNGDVRKSDF
jgi:hypothetical protein